MSRKLNKRELILAGMNEIILALNNEDPIDSWLMGGVPDGADLDEICEMANDDESFKHCASLFLDIMKNESAWNDGLYVSKELGVITADSRKRNPKIKTHRCKYCGSQVQSNIPSELCDKCKELFGHTYYDEL